MSVQFGSGANTAVQDPLADYNPAPLPHSGGAFINWHSPLSVLSSPVRGTLGGLRAGGNLIESVTRGLPGMGVAVGREGLNSLKTDWKALRHPSLEHTLPALTPGLPSSLTRGIQESIPALGLNFPGQHDEQFPLRPGEQPLPETPTGWDPFIAGVSRQSPAAGPLLGSLARTGQDIEQLQRAFGNRALPGQPFGKSVGQVGEGPGLLGKTAAAAAVARGGPGILPKALEDVTNVSLLTGPVEQAVGAGAKAASEEAAARAASVSEAEAAQKAAQTAAERNIDQAAQQYERAVQARADAAQEASAGHPAAAAQFQAAEQAVRSAGQALRDAQAQAEQVGAEHANNIDLAKQAADEAQARADTLKMHHESAKLAHNLGSKAAGSPFAPFEYGVPRLLKAAAPIANDLVGTELGQRFVQPIINRAEAFGRQVEANRVQGRQRETADLAKENIDQQLRQGFERTVAPLPTTEQEVGRGPFGLFGRKAVEVQDPEAHAVAMMSQTGEGAHLANLVRQFGRDEGYQHFLEANPNRASYPPELLDLAAEVYGGAPLDAISEKAAAIRTAIPEVKSRYAAEGGALDVQNLRYGQLLGEAGVPDVRPTPGAGAFEQVQHNLEGEGPRIEGLRQWQDAQARYASARFRGEKALEKAGKALTKAAEKVQGLGLTEAERANPRLLFQRIYEAPTAAARAIVGQGPHVWDAMAQSPEKGIAALAERVRSGQIDPEAAVQPLADQILKLARKDPDKLSPVALTLVEEARQRGMGQVGREATVATAASAAVPAQRIGVGLERARAGTALFAQGEGQLARADQLFGQASERMAAPTRARTAAVQAAHDRVVQAAAKLADLVTAARGKQAETGAAQGDQLAAAGLSHAQVAEEITSIRRAVQSELHAEAQAEIEELARDGVPKLKWPPDTVEGVTQVKAERGRGRDMRVRRWNPNYGTGDLRDLTESGDKYGRMTERKIIERGKQSGKVRESKWVPDPRFFSKDGLTPEQIDNAMARKASGAAGIGLEHGTEYGGAAGSAGSARVDVGQGVQEWLDRVERIRNMEREAGTLPGMTKAERAEVLRAGWEPGSDAAGRVEEALANTWGQQAARELARHIVTGDPLEVAAHIGDRLSEFAHGQDVIQEEQAARADAVARALEADRANEVQRGTVGRREGRATLDEIGKRLYDQQVAESRAGVQERVVGQREAVFGREAAAGAESARAQGQTEGRLLGRSEQLSSQAERALTEGERQAASGRAIVGQAPELAQRAAERVAGPVGQMYREVGRREQSLADATARYMKEQRALERLDEGLARRQEKLEQSVAAAPRPMRPVLELGQRLRKVLVPLADKADEEYGPGAGDVYRNAAAEATMISAETMSRFGIDPQYIIGQKERVAPLGTEGLSFERSGGPVVAKTGQREAGTGLKHATDYRTVYFQARRRAFQMIDNETGQRIIDATGGRLGEMLTQRGFDVEQIHTHEELAKAMKDAGLTAWNLADRRGGLLPQQQVNLETPVVPVETWRAWARYHETAGPRGAGGTFLKGYDKTTQTLKRIFRLSPRWQVAITVGHQIMAMTGGDINPVDYYGHAIPTAIRLDKLMRQGGPLTDADRAFVAKLPPDVQEALRANQGVPGAVRNRGFINEEFPTSEARRTRVGHRPMAMQTTLDNINRTAVWIHNLERGLDATGLADFRKAYPDLAHLTDAQIKNEAAIRLSIRAMGDYLNRTPFERQVISRVVFFYPWLRHITKLALNTAIHQPLRTAWILHLGAMFDPGPAPVDWLGKSFDAGKGRWVTPPTWNPYDAIVPYTDNPLGGLNPIVNTAIAGATGFNMGTGKPVTRPYFEPGGRLSLSELANYGVNQVPFVPAVRQSVPALFGGEPVARYQTGQPIITQRGFLPGNEEQFLGTNTSMPNFLGPWAPYLGLPYQRQIDAEAQAQREDEAARRNAAAARKYAVRRRLLAGA